MTEDQFKKELLLLLAMECAAQIDWAKVEAKCLTLIELTRDWRWKDLPAIARHFIDDCDVRRSDPSYALSQRADLARWLGVELKRISGS